MHYTHTHFTHTRNAQTCDAPQDKQADALREKMAMRLEHAPGGAREWRWLAFCLGQVGGCADCGLMGRLAFR
jgi:hypothetical protein